MTFQIIEIEGFQFGAGMDWPYSNGEPAAKAAELEAKGYLELKSDGKEIVGIATEMPAKNALYALAAVCLYYLTDEAQHAAFLIKTQNGIAFVGILDGLPVSGYDKIVNGDTMHDSLDKFIQDAGGVGVTIYTNIDQIVSEYHEIAQSINTEDLCNPLTEKKFAESVRIRKVSRGGWLWLVWIGVLICAASFMGWKWYQQQEMLAQAAKQAAQEKTPQQRYDESLKSAYSKAGWDLSEAMRVVGLIAEVELERGGWDTEKITCALAKRGCEVIWKKKGVAATFATFAKETPEAAKKLLKYQQDRIVENVEIATQPIHGWLTSELGGKTAIYTDQISTLQKLAATGDAQVTYREPTPYATNGQAIQKPAYQGGITFSGDTYIIPMLHRVNGHFISVSEIEFLFSGSKPTFKVEFNYYTGQP